MKFLAAFLLCCFASSALAELLQFEIGRGGPYAANAPVRVVDQAGKSVFEGYTDGYGRVSVGVRQAGQYTVRVRTRSGEKSSVVQLTGGSVRRVVTLQ
ncbi:MAG TPA: hypothetical protein VKG21_14615 [Casimicrobiaceae bacterium]|nr:hypothetical protein [Casimicrobiaceae bacterium]